MNRMTILVVEDDRAVRNLITTTLKANEYHFLTAKDGETGAMEAASHNPDVVLLDLGLPDMDGVEVIKRIRSWSNMPIIVISARSEDGDKISALDAGADDYLTKPFRVAELRARVAAHLRRQNRAPASRMVRGGIGFDLAAKTAMVGEQPLPFTRSEYAISEYLALHAGQTFSKEQIYEAVFGYDGTADDTAVTQHIKNIRAKLRTAGVAAPETVLKTIWGVGYQWKSET